MSALPRCGPCLGLLEILFCPDNHESWTAHDMSKRHWRFRLSRYASILRISNVVLRLIILVVLSSRLCAFSSSLHCCGVFTACKFLRRFIGWSHCNGAF